MKKFAPLLALCAMIFGCSPKEETADASSIIVEGAFSLTNGSWTYQDSIYEFEPLQLKIYSQGRYMFATWNAQTSSPVIGAGAAWSNEGMTLYEQPYFSANGPTDSSQTFALSIAVTADGFEQNIKGIDLNDSTKVDLFENWQSLQGDASPYDGLWQLTSHSGLAGVNDFEEIKMIGGGHFIWFHTYVDSTDHSDFGYGQFIDQSDGSVTEVLQVYSGSVLATDNEWRSEYKLLGTDVLEQTYINNSDSSKVYQTYKRL